MTLGSMSRPVGRTNQGANPSTREPLFPGALHQLWEVGYILHQDSDPVDRHS
jgi:hypothetical protein